MRRGARHGPPVIQSRTGKSALDRRARASHNAPMELVTIHVASGRIEAETVAAFLSAHDIDASVVADDAGGAGPNLAFVQGVPVQVRDSSADQARELLCEQAP